MIKKNINIGGFEYYTEMYDADIDLANNPHYEQFVMLRLFNMVNGIVYDTDIYFVEKNLFEEILNDCEENDTCITEKIVWPIAESANSGFSQSSTDFNDDLNEDTLSFQYYDLLDESGKSMKNILCNKLRIYHPLHRKKLDAVVYIENYINNIHFHYICRRFNSYEPKTETEIRKNYEIYSEFIEIWFPNIYSLFKQSTNDEYTFDVYYKEDLNIVTAPKSEEYIKRITKYVEEHDIESRTEYKYAENTVINEIVSDARKIDYDYAEDTEDIDLTFQNNIENDVIHENDENAVLTQIVPLSLLIQPSREIELMETDPITGEEVPAHYQNGDQIYAKLYLKQEKSIENNYITWPFNVTIYPYSSVDNNIYMQDNDLLGDTETYITRCNITLGAKLGFSDGILSLISTFDYPNKELFVKKYNKLSEEEKKNFSPVALAYLYYNNVKPIEYNKIFSSDTVQGIFRDIENITTLTDQDKQQLYDYYGEVKYIKMRNSFSEMLKAYKDMKKQAILEEMQDDRELDSDFIGFSIRIYTDPKQKNILFQNKVYVDVGADIYNPAFKLDNFAFKLNGIFSNWVEMPDRIYIRSTFIDKYLGITITSNYALITKEWYKYFINDNEYDYNKLNRIYEVNDKMKVIDLKDDNVNFINNITCVVNKTSQNNINLGRVGNKQRTLLKPYFFRVSDLQNIRIRLGNTQNIGVNLGDYMTKVETFHMYIDGNDFTEYGRNEIYVIFQIEASRISVNNGYYDIADQDGNYISTGQYTVY